MDFPPESAGAPEPASSVAVEKRDLLARLLGRLAHEIRNPLSSLDIHVQLLEEDLAKAPPATRQRLDIIRGELTRLEGIVRRFLRLASPSALEVEPVEIGAVIQHASKLLGPEAAARAVEIVTEVEPSLPILQGDSVQLTQVLLNLLINALQAVERHGKVQVRAGLSDCRRMLVVTVEDSGPGVPPEKLAAVFEPYFTTKEEGSGLGLWIAEQIAVAHGGTLQVANACTGGAVFTLSLPLPAVL
jgi:two-component system sensor histidine kinase HydH